MLDAVWRSIGRRKMREKMRDLLRKNLHKNTALLSTAAWLKIDIIG